MSTLASAGAAEDVELAAGLEPLHDLGRGFLLLHERLRTLSAPLLPLRVSSVIGVEGGGVGHDAVELVWDALLDAIA